MEAQRRVHWLTKVTQQANSRASKKSQVSKVLLWAILPLLTGCFCSWYPSLIKIQIKHSKYLLLISKKYTGLFFPLIPGRFFPEICQIGTKTNTYKLAIYDMTWIRTFTLFNHSHKHFVIFLSVLLIGNCFTILISFPWEHFVLKVSWYKANVLETGEAGEKLGRALFVSLYLEWTNIHWHFCRHLTPLPPSPHLLKICKDIFSLNFSEKEKDRYFKSILLINPKIFNNSHWLLLHDLDVRPRTAQLYSHIFNTRPCQRHLPLPASLFSGPSQMKNRGTEETNGELVMSTIAKPSSLRNAVEVCCHI